MIDYRPGTVTSLKLAGRAVSLAVLMALAVLPDPATAGTYDAWSCRTPNGEAAATRDDAGGWRHASINVAPEGGNRLSDTCSSGGSLDIRLAETRPQPTPSWASWNFDAPASTTIKRYSLDFDGYGRTANAPSTIYGDVHVLTSEQSDPDYDERFYGTGPIQRRSVEHGGRSARSLVVQASCSDNTGAGTPCAPGPDGSPARFSIYRATFTLEDRDAPAVTSVSGDAVTGDLWAGATGIAVGATDAGGGVYRLGVEVDGQIRSWINMAGAPCQAWPGTERTFLSPKPCPSTVGGVQRISTADLPEGSHTVRVIVEDAAGNQTTAYGPVSKTISRTAAPGPADPGPENGTPAVGDANMKVSWEGRESATRSIRYDQQPVLRGQLTTKAGQPIKDAAVRVSITRTSRNSPPFERESLQTNSEGRFRWKMPKGSSSRTITLSYRRRVRDPQPVVSKTLKLQVTAGVRLKLSRRTVRRGQTVKLTGTVVGRPVPTGGKVVELQARNAGGKWITFRTVRARKSGAFKATYRFRNAGPARFQMRARARRSGDYPYSTGSSPVRRITVR